MWDDEPPAWGVDDDTPAADGTTAGADGEAATEPVPVILLADREKAPKPHYTLHWVRPLILWYDYLHDYRKNYYDDVIDYLDKRQRGIWRETPRAQEWSERALRTYYSKIYPKSPKHSADMHYWMTKFAEPSRHYSYHTRAYYSLKYQKIL
ncbi:flightin [Athalia rosae]|uniref:flightin n=1 Tax=Athalia rosae TaxID=37344 RepID=UPI0020332398|nr:flightin [Athalia rosae]